MKKDKTQFIVSKAQIAMLTAIQHGFIRPTLYTDLGNLALDFINEDGKSKLSRPTMLALISKRLIKYDLKLLSYTLTNLGKRMVKLGNKSPNRTIVSTLKIKSTDITLSVKSSNY